MKNSDMSLRTTLAIKVDKEALELFKMMNLLLVGMYIRFRGLII